jgi:hypothetical protein
VIDPIKNTFYNQVEVKLRMNKILGLAMIFLCCPFLGRSFADKIVLSRAEVNYNIYQTLDTLGLEGFSFKDEIAECIAE